MHVHTYVCMLHVCVCMCGQMWPIASIRTRGHVRTHVTDCVLVPCALIFLASNLVPPVVQQTQGLQLVGGEATLASALVVKSQVGEFTTLRLLIALRAEIGMGGGVRVKSEVMVSK